MKVVTLCGIAGIFLFVYNHRTSPKEGEAVVLSKQSTDSHLEKVPPAPNGKSTIFHPPTWKIAVQVDGLKGVASIDPLTYHLVEKGDKVKVRYRRTSFFGDKIKLLSKKLG